METLITINNDNLANYAMFKLNKLDNEFTEEELDQIDELVINYDDEKDNSFLEELLKFKKVQRIILRNGYIYNDNFNIFLRLTNLRDITFERCEFENVNSILSLKLKSLSLINCSISDYSFVYLFRDLEELAIVNGNVEIRRLNTLDKLRYLQLSFSDIIDNDSISILSLEELYLDNTNIKDFYFLNNLSNLKRVSIDEMQYSINKDLFEGLRKKGVLVLFENMVEFGGDNNE